MKKILIIRLSSFGDVLQSLSIPGSIRNQDPDSEVHWLTKEPFKELIKHHPDVKRVHVLKSNLWSTFKYLLKENFTHIYDAHNNLRSNVLKLFFLIYTRKTSWLTRPSQRWKRPFLFFLRWNLYEQPFNAQRDLIKPLSKWHIKGIPPTPQLFFPPSIELPFLIPYKKFVVLAPSAAHPLKRWPLSHWQSLIDNLKHINFIVVGGPSDLFLKKLNGKHITFCIGETSLLQSAYIISKAQALVANDTGLMHVGEQLGLPTIALMGPAPFGYPCRPSTEIFDKQLPCQPCSRHGQGPCRNRDYQKCLTSISPNDVASRLLEIIK